MFAAESIEDFAAKFPVKRVSCHETLGHEFMKFKNFKSGVIEQTMQTCLGEIPQVVRAECRPGFSKTLSVEAAVVRDFDDYL